MSGYYRIILHTVKPDIRFPEKCVSFKVLLRIKFRYFVTQPFRYELTQFVPLITVRFISNKEYFKPLFKSKQKHGRSKILFDIGCLRRF
jgi:hypothetical protein